MSFEYNVGKSSGNTERGDYIPTSIISDGLLSDDSEAYVCFTEQKFSSKLQSYMINYVISISGLYSVYA